MPTIVGAFGVIRNVDSNERGSAVPPSHCQVSNGGQRVDSAPAIFRFFRIFFTTHLFLKYHTPVVVSKQTTHTPTHPPPTPTGFHPTHRHPPVSSPINPLFLVRRPEKLLRSSRRLLVFSCRLLTFYDPFSLFSYSFSLVLYSILPFSLVS